VGLDVEIFTRKATATDVRVAAVLRLDANTKLSSAQNNDVYLDGSRIEAKTHHLTHVKE
jgi:hypothetical protein